MVGQFSLNERRTRFSKRIIDLKEIQIGQMAVTSAPNVSKRRETANFQGLNTSNSDVGRNSIIDATEMIRFADIAVYLARQNHTWLLDTFPITFGDCTSDLLERNFLAAAHLCIELSKDCRNLTDEEILNHVVNRLKSSEPLEFTVYHLFDYLTSGDHNWLIRTYRPFVACTHELLERNFSFVFARCQNMRQGGRAVSDEQFQELVDLMRSPKRRRCP